jgi:hypothetical protein
MRIIFINPPRTNFDCEEVAPPLGLVRLAGVAERCGWKATLEDYNLLWHLDEELRSDFYAVALDRLLGLDADVYAFTSMAVDSHLAIELSRQLKLKRPSAKVLFGGPHFSSIADEVKRYFPWVDAVIRGEGEEMLARELSPGWIPDLSRAFSVAQWLDHVPLDPYFYVNPRKMINLECGRGCKFKCSFCYSPGHHSGARDFPEEGVLQDIARLSERGVKHVWFVGDNFLNNTGYAKALCSGLESQRLGVTWSCYATFPQLSSEIIGRMGVAGCREVFCGIDAVSTEAERSFQKAFLRGATSMTTKIGQLNAAEIHPTFAFLVAPPSHPAGAGNKQSILASLEAQTAGAETLLNPLSLYSQTKARESYRTSFSPDEKQARLMMDVPDIGISNPYSIEHPELFPFHSRFAPKEEWEGYLEAIHCTNTLIHTFPETLSSLWEEQRIGPDEVATRALQLFEDWDALGRQDIRLMEQHFGAEALGNLSEARAGQ